MSVVRCFIVMFALLMLEACDPDQAFHCVDDAQCGQGGLCEPTSLCSFEDEACGSGRRYGDHAPQGVAHACVPDEAEDEQVAPEPGVCAAEASCEACVACSLYEGPCASSLVACLDEACFEGATCAQSCMLTGLCGDCCTGSTQENAEAIEDYGACVMAECGALCGGARSPRCGA